jgi:hypothetical protein
MLLEKVLLLAADISQADLKVTMDRGRNKWLDKIIAIVSRICAHAHRRVDTSSKHPPCHIP